MKKICLFLSFIILSLTLLGQIKMPVTMVVPDNEKSMQDDKTMAYAVSKVERMLAERGLPLARFSSEDKDQNVDILIEVSYSTAQSGRMKSVECELRAVEGATKKVLARTQSQSSPSFSMSTEALIDEALRMQIDDFSLRLQWYFESLLM